MSWVSHIVAFGMGAVVGAVGYAVASKSYVDEVVYEADDVAAEKSYTYPSEEESEGGASDDGGPSPFSSTDGGETAFQGYIFSQPKIEEKEDKGTGVNPLRKPRLRLVIDEELMDLLDDENVKDYDLSLFADGVWVNDNEPYQPVDKGRIAFMLGDLGADEFEDGDTFYDDVARATYTLSKYDYEWKNMAYYPGTGE